MLDKGPNQQRKNGDDGHGGEDEGWNPVAFGLDSKERKGDAPEDEEADWKYRRKGREKSATTR